jgi:hypothetical protein
MTLNITDIELFTLLKAKIGEKEASAVIDYVKQETAATASKTSEYFSKDIANLQKHIDEKFKDMATKEFVEKEISVSKTESLKWVVGLFITLALMILGLYFKK